MKTNNFLELLSEDLMVSSLRKSSFNKMATIGFLIACLALLFMSVINLHGVRPQYFTALMTGFVSFKQIMPVILAALIFPYISKIQYPETIVKISDLIRIWPYFVVMVFIFIITIFSTEAPQILMAMRGKSIPFCMTLIPVFALPIYTMIIMHLKSGAPTNMVQSGFWAGLFSGALGCFVYAFTCVDDNPLFWTWAYSCGILISGLMGAFVGKYALRW